MGCHCDVDGVVGSQEDDRVVSQTGDCAEVLFGVMVGQIFEEFEDLDLGLENGVGSPFVRGDSLVQKFEQPLHAVDFDELSVHVPG